MHAIVWRSARAPTRGTHVRAAKGRLIPGAQCWGRPTDALPTIAPAPAARTRLTGIEAGAIALARHPIAVHRMCVPIRHGAARSPMSGQDGNSISRCSAAPTAYDMRLAMMAVRRAQLAQAGRRREELIYMEKRNAIIEAGLARIRTVREPSPGGDMTQSKFAPRMLATLLGSLVAAGGARAAGPGNDEALRNLPLGEFVEITSLEQLANMVVTDTKVAQAPNTVTQNILVLRHDDFERQPDVGSQPGGTPPVYVGQFVNVLSRNDANWGSYAGLGPVQQLPAGRPAHRFLRRCDESRQRGDRAHRGGTRDRHRCSIRVT